MARACVQITWRKTSTKIVNTDEPRANLALVAYFKYGKHPACYTNYNIDLFLFSDRGNRSNLPSPSLRPQVTLLFLEHVFATNTNRHRPAINAL